VAGTNARYEAYVSGEDYQYGASLTSGFGTLPERREGLGANVLTGQAGIVFLAYVRAPKSMVLANIGMVSTTQAAVGSTLVRFGVYTIDGSGNLTLAASTTNDTSIFSVASTRYTKAASGSLQLVKGQWYAQALLIVGASTMPGVMGAVTPSTNFNVYNLAPRLAGQLAGQTDLPASIAVGSVASTNIVLWAELT